MGIFQNQKGPASIEVGQHCSRDVVGLWLHCRNALETVAPSLQTWQYTRYQPIIDYSIRYRNNEGYRGLFFPMR